MAGEISESALDSSGLNVAVERLALHPDLSKVAFCRKPYLHFLDYLI